jgi:hypothetical protein
MSSCLLCATVARLVMLMMARLVFLGAGSDGGVEMEELCGGARIMYLFNEVSAARS